MFKYKALKGKVIVSELDFGERVLKSGIILGNENGKMHGIISRWVKVFSVGEGIEDIKEGQYILVKHGRWSRTIVVEGEKLNLVEYPAAVLAVADHKPSNETIRDSV